MLGSMGMYQSSLNCERLSLPFKNCFGFGSNATSSYQPENQSSNSDNSSLPEENMLPASTNRTSRTKRNSSKKSNFSKEGCCCRGSEVDKDDFAYNICSPSTDSQLCQDGYLKGSSETHQNQCTDCKTNRNETAYSADLNQSDRSRASTLSEVPETADLLKGTTVLVKDNGNITTVVNINGAPDSFNHLEGSHTKDNKQIDLKINSETEVKSINENSLIAPTVETLTEAKNNQAENMQLSKSEDISTNITTSSGEISEAEHFRVLVSKETEKLNNLIDSWNLVLEDKTSLCPTEVCDEIRSVIGKTRLVIAERFTQFLELVDKAVGEDSATGERPVLLSDLQGFWDMIYFQVEDVNAKFGSLSELKRNEWKTDDIVNKKAKPDPVEPKQAVKRPAKQVAKKKKSQVSAEEKKRREAARKRLAEARKALAQRNQVEQDNNCSSATPESVCNKMTFIASSDVVSPASSSDGSSLPNRPEPMVDAVSCSVAVGQASSEVSSLPAISSSLVH